MNFVHRIPRWSNRRSIVTLPAMFKTSANKRVAAMLAGLGQITLLAVEVFSSLLRGRIVWGDWLRQLYFIGVKSQAVVGVAGCDELGPVLTALMVAGRVGAAMAAEIGTMRVTEQIDALRALATHPVDYLVVPRVAAGHVALPLLTAESICVGIGASYLVCVQLLGVDPTYLWYNMLRFTGDVDVFIGVTKAFIFGGIIALIGCYKGLTCGLGAEGVGRATTEAVVYACITVLITDFFLTMLLTVLLGEL